MQTLVKVHCTKLFCLLLLLLVWGALLPAYACSPEVDTAIAQLQKSARANIRAEDWLVQVVDKTSNFDNLKSKGSLEIISGTEIVKKKLWAALFPDMRSLGYFKKYLAEVKIRKDSYNESASPRKFQFNEKTSYTYYYRYPSSNSLNVRPESACQFEIILLHIFPVGEEFAENSYFYTFEIVDGKMKLIRLGMAG